MDAGVEWWSLVVLILPGAPVRVWIQEAVDCLKPGDKDEREGEGITFTPHKDKLNKFSVSELCMAGYREGSSTRGKAPPMLTTFLRFSKPP